MSLDGYIADHDGGYDWIVMDPDIDFDALFAEFDTILMGRRTFEVVGGDFPGKKVYVFSRTLRPEDHPGVTIVRDRIEETLDALRREAGKDIWLYGGGELFRTLLEMGFVDTVEPAVIPVLLGGGLRFLPEPAIRTRLEFRGQRHYPVSGIVILRYGVRREA